MDRNSGFTLIEVLVALAVLSIGALAVMRHVSQVQDMLGDIGHMNTMTCLASMKLHELEAEGFSSSFSQQGGFPLEPGFSWAARSNVLATGGWYRLELVVRREDSGRTITIERFFQEMH